MNGLSWSVSVCSVFRGGCSDRSWPAPYKGSPIDWFMSALTRKRVGERSSHLPRSLRPEYSGPRATECVSTQCPTLVPPSTPIPNIRFRKLSALTPATQGPDSRA